MNTDLLVRHLATAGWVIAASIVGCVIGLIIGAIAGLIIEGLFFADLPKWLPSVIEDTRQDFVVSIFATVGWASGLTVGGLSAAVARR